MKEFKPTKEDELIGPQLAVQRYLDELLQDATISHLNDLANDNDVNHSEEERSENSLESESSDASSNLADSSLALEDEDVSEKQVESSLSTTGEDLSEKESENDLVEDEADVSFDAPLKETDPIKEKSDDEYNFDNLDAAFADFEAAVQDESMHHTGEEGDLSHSVSDKVVEDGPDEHSVVMNAEVEATVAVVSDELESHSIVEASSLPSPVQPKRLRPTIKSDLDDLIGGESKAENAAPALSKTDPLPWAKSRFECLLFKVGGLKMAVPLVELGGIQKADKSNITPLFGQPKWFLGVATVHEKHIRTVDTALWVMPNHYQGDLKENFKFVIQLDRSDWGLACEIVAEAITLEPSAVKWRSDRSKRPWLAGTVIEHMCAILDVQGFIELLNDPKNGFKAHLK